MKLIPTKKQFLNWSIPSKVGYIAFVATFIAIVLTIAIFIIQLCVGASKELQNEASKDRNVKHEELVDYFVYIDNKLQLQTSSYEDMRETINRISSKIEDNRLVQNSIINREIQEASKYYPSGYKLEGFIIGPTEISKN